eukprot:Hpha_TRINITY_DN11616_c0_g1::TRINITY_DN11616_c0_g1_i1::g.49075::m.49075
MEGGEADLLGHAGDPEAQEVQPVGEAIEVAVTRAAPAVAKEPSGALFVNTSLAPDAVYEEISREPSPVEGPRVAQLGAWQKKIRLEAQLFQRQALPIVLAALSLGYISMMVTRNLAYYRYRVGPRLKDIGHDIFPELPAGKEKLSDVPMYGYYLVLGSTIAAGIRPGDASRPFVANIARRVIQMFAIGHILRAFTYLATSVPGSADHCLPGADLEPPKSIGECFTKMSSVNGNCGDLIFSGHMLLMWLGFCFLWTYAPGCWGVDRLGREHIAILCIGFVIVIAQACMILAARHHYSVDVVVSTYTTPFLWHTQNTVWYPQDQKPDLRRLERTLGEETTWPWWRHALRWLLVAFIVFISFVGLWTIMKGNLKAFT